jgi:hypothetical protein
MAQLIIINEIHFIELEVKKTFIENYKLEKTLRYNYYQSYGYDLDLKIPEKITLCFQPIHNYSKPHSEIYLMTFLNEFKIFLDKYKINLKHTDELLFLGLSFTDSIRHSRKTQNKHNTSDHKLLLQLISVPFLATPTRENFYDFLYGNDLEEKNEELISMLMAYTGKPIESFFNNNLVDITKITTNDWSKLLNGIFIEKNISVHFDEFILTVSKDITAKFDHPAVDGLFATNNNELNSTLIKAIIKALVADVKRDNPLLYSAILKYRFGVTPDIKRLLDILKPHDKLRYKSNHLSYIKLFDRYLKLENLVEINGKGISSLVKVIFFDYLNLLGLILKDKKLAPYEDVDDFLQTIRKYKNDPFTKMDLAVQTITEYMRKD